MTSVRVAFGVLLRAISALQRISRDRITTGAFCKRPSSTPARTLVDEKCTACHDPAACTLRVTSRRVSVSGGVCVCASSLWAGGINSHRRRKFALHSPSPKRHGNASDGSGRKANAASTASGWCKTITVMCSTNKRKYYSPWWAVQCSAVFVCVFGSGFCFFPLC